MGPLITNMASSIWSYPLGLRKSQKSGKVNSFFLWPKSFFFFDLMHPNLTYLNADFYFVRRSVVEPADITHIFEG